MSLVVRETAVAATASTTPGGAGVPGAFLAASPAPSAPHAGDASAVSLASDASAVSSAAAAAPHHAAAKHHHPVVPPGDFAARRWIVLFVSCVGVFLASVSTSALIIAFPTVIIALKTELATMMWVLLVVLLCIASVAPLAGKLGDVFGQAGLYKAGFGVFVLGSLGGGLSSVDAKGLDLIGARIAVGVGAGFLFTNSIAIVTDAFAPYNQVGLAQGVFQLCAALGTVLGPLVGGGLATATKDSWRWIFFFNVPSGGLCFLLALWAVRDARPPVKRTWAEHAARLDWLGAASCVLGLILLLLAMIQAVSPTPPLNSPGPLAGLIAGGCVSGAIFIAAEFYATDPLVPPRLFLNWSFTVTTLAGTFMAFVRNSITYNMIFFLQGPAGQDPLVAGISLIPFGIGLMIAGFAAGALADKVGVRNMATAGPIVAMLAVIGLSQLTKTASGPMIGGLLFLAGLGCGLFQSPNGMANILSVKPSDRGVASSISILTLMFCSMVGIVVTFSFVLNSMDQATLFKLFIYGGASLPDAAVQSCLDALRKDWYIVIAACLAGAACASQIPHDFSAASAQARATAGDKPAEAAVADGAAADAAALAKGKAGVEDGGGAGDEAAPPTIVEFVAGAPFATDAEPPAADEPAPAAAATAEEPTAASA